MFPDPHLRPSRRDLLRATAAAAACASSGLAFARTGGDWTHGFSPLGRLAYPPGFAAFAYVDPDAPKGGTLRLARVGAFDTTDTLHYPGNPAADIRLVYDRLVVASDDEIASFYGLLARALRVADDFSRVCFRLDERARWHDGAPVTAADVAFTFETLKAEGAPFYRQAFRPLSVAVEDERTVCILSERPNDRDLLRRLSSIPIHPAHHWRNRSREEARAAPLGSGPYRLVSAEAPRRVVLERVPGWWAADHPTSRGRWNFDRIEIDFYRDATVALEAFRADGFDLRFEDDPTRWRNAYAGPAFEAGRVRTATFDGEGPGTLHGLAFNLRRPILADRRVRLALTLAWDFEAANRTLFSGGYERFGSVFAGSPLEARGPAGPDERALLAVAGVADGAPMLADPDPLSDLPAPGTRAALAAASRLLEEAGLSLEAGARVDPATGAPVALSVVSPNPLYDRPLGWLERTLSRLGIRLVRVRTDPAAAARRMLDREFDLAALSWSPARLPGTAERLLWHADLAEAPGSYALSGLDDRAVDRAIEALEAARSPEALETAGRAFDRAFRHALAMLPLWRSDTVRLAWWDRFGRPDETGLVPVPVERWWANDPARE